MRAVCRQSDRWLLRVLCLSTVVTASILPIGTGSFAQAAPQVEQGELRFTVGGRNFSTRHAQGVLQTRNGKSRIFIAVKDVESRFMLVLTADVPAGSEKQPMSLDTHNSELTVSLRTPQGTLSVMPEIQLARGGDKIQYAERTVVDTGELEDDPDDVAAEVQEQRLHPERKIRRQKRKKFRSEYKKSRPRWASMSRNERMQTGEGIMGNKAFRDTYFNLQLIPVLSQGKVTSYTGSFAGTARFAHGAVGGEIRPVQNGIFNIQVIHANEH